MRNAGKAMKDIHGGMTIDEVDKTMDELREQQQLGEEIASAIQNASMGEGVDEAELEEELEGLEQEALDEKMLRTGTVPVGGELSRIPAVPGGVGKLKPALNVGKQDILTSLQCQTNRLPQTKTKKRNYGNYRRRWPCKRTARVIFRLI